MLVVLDTIYQKKKAMVDHVRTGDGLCAREQSQQAHKRYKNLFTRFDKTYVLKS